MFKILNVTYSPCPNDTFIFHAWTHNLLTNAPKIKVTLNDIHITNEMAVTDNHFDIMKISVAALPYISDKYKMISCGGALGINCGPLILTKKSLTIKSLEGKTLAIPSYKSTAYLLFIKWLQEENIDVNKINIINMPFNQIMPSLTSNIIDAGLVIHEARFIYKQYNLKNLVDLGEWWEATTKLPIPLGCIVIRKSLDHNVIENIIRDSIKFAWKNPQISIDYIKKNAQEISSDIVQNHINLYVNKYSLDIGHLGRAAINELLK